MRVLRVYHGGRNTSHRQRERALRAAGIDVTLVAPATWPEGGESQLSDEGFPIIELAVARSGDVNRHTYTEPNALARLIRELEPELLDLHEEPFSLAARQWLAAAPPRLPVVMYTAQNVDKRYPPPFAQYERAAHRRVAALYACSHQAASVARGKGFEGIVEVLPLGYDESLFAAGSQSLEDDELILTLLGRLVPEKGVRDAVHALARLNATRPARLVLVGSGPEKRPARELAASLGVAERVEIQPWRSAAKVAEIYRRAHVVLVPSASTETWTEQFGRVIVEGHASGAVVAGYSSGTIPEVSDGVAALVAPGDVGALGDAVVRLTRDPELWADLRTRGLELSRTRTWACVAERQADLYRRVAAGEAPRRHFPRSPRARRSAAQAEFGSTAPLSAGVRPFALPVLRRGGAFPAALAAIIDAGSEIATRIRR